MKNILIKLIIIFCSLRFLQSQYQISVIINQKGNQKILSDNFNNLPKRIEINGVQSTVNRKPNLKMGTNTIIMIWENYITNMQDMFYGCSSIISIDFSNFDSSSVTNMKAMFAFCYSLKSLDLSNFKTSNVSIMINMFYCCKSLTTLNLSTFDTSKIDSLEGFFCGCSSLEYIDISNFNTTSVTTLFKTF